MFRRNSDFDSRHDRYNRPTRWPKLVCQFVGTLAYYPFYSVYELKYRLRDAYKNSDYFYRKKMAERVQPPPVTKRKRALTNPQRGKDQKLTVRKQKCYAQSQSILFQIPVEIRLLIWEACVGSDDIYVLLTHNLSPRTTQDEFEELQSFSNEDAPKEPIEDFGGPRPLVVKNIEKRRRQRKRLGVLPLLQTCRSIYSEVLKTLYSKSGFTFCDIQSFLAFSGSVLPHRLNQITTIKLDFRELRRTAVIHALEITPLRHPGDGFYPDLINNSINYAHLKSTRVTFHRQLLHPSQLNGNSSWHVACNILCEMQGLRELSIMIDYDRYCAKQYGTIKDTIFEPMKPVYEKKLDNFTAYLDWWPGFGSVDPSLPPQFLEAPSSLPDYSFLPRTPLRWTLVDGQLVWTKIEDESN